MSLRTLISCSCFFFFFSSRRRHTRCSRDWSSDVCSSDLVGVFIRYVVPRAILGALPVLALLLWFKFGLDVHGIGQLTGAGVAMTLVFGLLWVFFVYRNDPYVDLRGRLVGQRGGARW